MAFRRRMIYLLTFLVNTTVWRVGGTAVTFFFLRGGPAKFCKSLKAPVSCLNEHGRRQWLDCSWFKNWEFEDTLRVDGWVGLSETYILYIHFYLNLYMSIVFDSTSDLAKPIMKEYCLATWINVGPLIRRSCHVSWDFHPRSREGGGEGTEAQLASMMRGIPIFPWVKHVPAKGDVSQDIMASEIKLGGVLWHMVSQD